MINADQGLGVTLVIPGDLHRRVRVVVFDALQNMPERVPVEWLVGAEIPGVVLVAARNLGGRENGVYSDVPPIDVSVGGGRHPAQDVDQPGCVPVQVTGLAGLVLEASPGVLACVCGDAVERPCLVNSHPGGGRGEITFFGCGSAKNFL
eukprot:1807963-Heterocapsa_arctica.AAC.1